MLRWHKVGLILAAGLFLPPFQTPCRSQTLPSLPQSQETTSTQPAGTPKPNSILLRTGASTSENQSSMFQVGAGYGWGLSRNFTLILDAEFVDFTNYDVNYKTTYSGALRSLTFLVEARGNFTDRDNPVVFYGIAGAGAALMSVDAFQSHPANDELDPALMVGLGIDIRLNQATALDLQEGGVFPFTQSLFPNQFETLVPAYAQVIIGLKLNQ